MERNFFKTRLAARRSPTTPRWRWALLICLTVVLLISMVGIGSFLFKKSEEISTANYLVSRLRIWLEERKTTLQYSEAKTKVKTPAVLERNDGDSQVHFEFYSELPNVPSSTPDEVIARAPLSPFVATTTKIKTREVVRVPVKSSNHKATPFVVVSAEELEKELSHQITQKKYIIQLGMFRDGAAATRYRKVLLRAGFTVTVVKIKDGKQQPIYRIQQGPFLDLHHARTAQKVLQKRGIASLVVKMKIEA